ncbi:MAG: hypothetical protein ACD_4C00127G0005 [uncultured bacterium (gcode 4)]|uniref:Uncharacterized protein n=1 Tax=uncultured bacterium (gcode 4) TaxID=1234023 RepID=K2G9Q1_9BACT|nr:MAG: hypothetical protein ACD_4C00127G0005 [uncultured bacterium (gcode 4)]
MACTDINNLYIQKTNLEIFEWFEGFIEEIKQVSQFKITFWSKDVYRDSRDFYDICSSFVWTIWELQIILHENWYSDVFLSTLSNLKKALRYIWSWVENGEFVIWFFKWFYIFWKKEWINHLVRNKKTDYELIMNRI